MIRALPNNESLKHQSYNQYDKNFVASSNVFTKMKAFRKITAGWMQHPCYSEYNNDVRVTMQKFSF